MFDRVNGIFVHKLQPLIDSFAAETLDSDNLVTRMRFQARMEMALFSRRVRQCRHLTDAVRDFDYSSSI